jgi:hypothetical protein
MKRLQVRKEAAIMPKAHVPAPDQYKESVREVILSGPHADIEEEVLEKVATYLWWNGYKKDDGRVFGGSAADAIFAYEVLVWTEMNT